MLGLADFDLVAEILQDPYERFAQAVINDIARQLVKMGMSPASQWQVQRLMESGKTYNYVIEKLAKLVPQTQAELRKEFKKFGFRTVRYDNAILRAAGLTPDDLNLSPAMMNVLETGLRKTQGLLHNLTMTTANTSEQLFIDAADLAYMEVAHGTMSYGQAIKEAIKSVAKKGITVINYPSGRHNKLDVAVRRAVLTGVAQTTGDIQLKNLIEMGVELVAVSAHIGARNKGGIPENHELWQGRVFSITIPRLPGYSDFYSATGYGKIEGLCGVNCRHSFYPFFEGLSTNAYSKEDLKYFRFREVTYNGKIMSFYDATQIQRSIERDIREAKRIAEALRASGIDNVGELDHIRQLQAVMRDFIDQTGIHRQPEREGERVLKLETETGRAARERKQELIREQELARKEAERTAEEKEEARIRELERIKEQGISKDILSEHSVLEDMLANNTITVDAKESKISRGYFEKWLGQVHGDGKVIIKPQTTYGDHNLTAGEVLAYRLSEAAGFGVVPVTIFRDANTFPDATGTRNFPYNASFQQFIENAVVGALMDGRDWKIADPKSYSRMMLLDFVGGNWDRNTGNLLMDSNGIFWAIDNGMFMSRCHQISNKGMRFWYPDEELIFYPEDIDRLFSAFIDPEYKKLVIKYFGFESYNLALENVEWLVANKEELKNGTALWRSFPGRELDW